MVPALRDELAFELRREAELAAVRHRTKEAAAERPWIDSPRRRLPRRLTSAVRALAKPTGIRFEVGRR